MSMRFKHFPVFPYLILLCCVTTAQAVSPSAGPPLTGVRSQVYLVLGEGPIHWVKISCPIRREELDKCDVTAVVKHNLECMKFIWKSSETVPWDWPDRQRPNSNFLAMLQPALKEDFLVVERVKKASHSVEKLSFFRPKDTAGFPKPRFPDFLELESLSKQENALPKVQHIVRAEDDDMLRFASASDRACIGQSSQTFTNLSH